MPRIWLVICHRGVSANRSLQVSQIVEETPQHRLEQYGGPLPVLVTEALIMADSKYKDNVNLVLTAIYK